MSISKWQTPPQDPKEEAEEIFRQLRDNPERWALVMENVGVFSASRQQTVTALKKYKTLDIKVVPQKEMSVFSPVDVYARYVGDSSGQ